MRGTLPRTLGYSLLLASAMTLLGAGQAFAAANSPNPGNPIWATINADASGNYPGGNEQFTVFIVNSAQSATMNETIENATLTAPWPGGSNFGSGLPTTLTQGQGITLLIHLQIPSNFTQSSFTANLVIHALLINGTSKTPVTLTGQAPVNVFALPGSSSQTTQSTSAAGTVPTNTFYIGVALPSIVAIIFLVLFAQARTGSRRAGP